MPPALPPWPAPDAPAAAPAPTTRPPAAPPSRAGPLPSRAPAPPPSTSRPCGCSTARRRAAGPPGGPAACRAAPASGSSLSSRCAVAGRRARPGPRRCSGPAASRPTAPRTRSSRPPRPPRDPSPAARSPGRAGPSGRPPRRGTAPPAPPRSSVPPLPPRIRLPQAKAPGYRLRHPAGTITEHISRKPYHFLVQALERVRGVQLGAVLGGEARAGQHVVLALVHQRGELRPAGPELVGHLPPDLVRARLVGLQERLAQRGGDHRLLALAHVRQGAPHPVDSAALPGGAQHAPDRALEALVGVRDDELHALEAAPDQAPQERGPEGLGLRGAEVQADDLAPPLAVDRHGDYRRDRHDPAALPDLQVRRVQPEVRPLPLQRAGEEGVHALVDVLAQLGDRALRDAREPHGLHEIVHPPGRDPADPRLLDDGH